MTYTVEQLEEALGKLEGRLDEATSAFVSESETVSNKINVVRDRIWELKEEDGTLDAETITEQYVAIRDQRTALKKKFSEDDEALKSGLEKRDAWLLEALDSIGAQSLKANSGTAFIQTKTRYNCSDWEHYYGFIKENDRFDLLEKRPAQGPLKKIQEDGEELPPGISTFSERTITVRRS